MTPADIRHLRQIAMRIPRPVRQKTDIAAMGELVLFVEEYAARSAEVLQDAPLSWFERLRMWWNWR